MVATRDFVEALSDGALKTILKPNQQSIIQFYFRSIDSFVDTMADLGMYKLMKKCVEIYKVRPRRKKGKKKKKFDRTQTDALSDTSGSDGRGGRMFAKPKQKFRSIMDHGWTSAVTREAIPKPPTTISADDDGDDDSDENGEGTKKKGMNAIDEGDIHEAGCVVSADGEDEDEHNKKKKVQEEEDEEEVKGEPLHCMCYFLFACVL
jgi:hypothetical protein